MSPFPSSADAHGRADPALSLQVLFELFEAYGGTDVAYLIDHHDRFLATIREFDSSWDRSRGVRILDVGAHWLHQAVLWRRAGYDVTAVDLPTTFELENVRRCAKAEGIELIPDSDLEHCPSLAALPSASFNVVLFTEIIEHITFNPVRMWREIHRLLAPGGRIIVTTPNYYGWNKRAWNVVRFLAGNGGGIPVRDIIQLNTHSHHWREFSKRELVSYFSLLSSDFVAVKVKTARSYRRSASRRSVQVARAICELLPALRPNLYLEVELISHHHGIAVQHDC